MLRPLACAGFFERRKRRWNKDHLIEPECLARLPAKNQMAEMNRIERSAVNADFLQATLLLMLQPRMHNELTQNFYHYRSFVLIGVHSLVNFVCNE